MRIAMLTNNYKPFVGGVPISIERLSKSLRDLGHEVYIFAPTYRMQEEEECVIRYKAFEYTLGKDKIAIPNMFDRYIEDKIKELNIDVIHVHHPLLVGWTSLYLGNKYNIPVTFTYHTRFEQYIHYIKPFKKLEEYYESSTNKFIKVISKSILDINKNKLIPWGTKVFANRCDNVFAPTELMKEYLEEVGVESKMEIIPTGITNNYFNQCNEKANLIREKYIEDKEYLFCTVSRLAKEKNIEFILKGLENLKSKVGNNFKVLIIGQGPLKEQLEKEAIERGIYENVEFVGSVANEELPDYYKACDMFLFASKSETQGIVLLEAMAANNPVIAIEASGVVEVVENGKNGFMTQENVNEWVEKIIYLISNKDEMESVRNGAYETATRYSEARISKLAESGYKEAIKILSRRKEENHQAVVYNFR